MNLQMAANKGRAMSKQLHPAVIPTIVIPATATPMPAAMPAAIGGRAVLFCRTRLSLVLIRAVIKLKEWQVALRG